MLIHFHRLDLNLLRVQVEPVKVNQH